MHHDCTDIQTSIFGQHSIQDSSFLRKRTKQKSSPPRATFTSDNPADNTLFPSRLSNARILLSPKIVQGSRSSGIGVYEFLGQWTILFLGTGFSAVLEGLEEEWRIVWKRFSPLSAFSLLLFWLHSFVECSFYNAGLFVSPIQDSRRRSSYSSRLCAGWPVLSIQHRLPE